jgi:molecular chaperone GrpE
MTWKIHRHPSEPTGSVSEENAGRGVETPTDDGSVPPQDPVAQLQADLAAAKAESEEWRDRFLRKAAEFDNYRKRTEKEKLDFMNSAKGAVLVEFLPVVDACERALESLNKAQAGDDTLQQYRSGVELLYRQLGGTLERLGVVPVETEGRAFDPHVHEAISREVSTKHDENEVTRELRRGYMFRDRLLRPAQVVVSTRPKDEQPAES